MPSPYENSSSIMAPGHARRGYEGKEQVGTYYEKSSSIMRSGRSCPLAKSKSLKPTSATTQAMGTLDAEAALFIAGPPATIWERNSTCP